MSNLDTQALVGNIKIPEGVNNEYTNFSIKIMTLPKINVKDPEQLRSRIVEYFQICADHDMKPAVSGLSFALGIDRRRLWEVKTDQKHIMSLPDECKLLIKDAYMNLEMLWEMYMLNGKINPVTGIFLGKNNFNYVDKQEHVLTPNNQLIEADVATIAKKYEELPE